MSDQKLPNPQDTAAVPGAIPGNSSAPTQYPQRGGFVAPAKNTVTPTPHIQEEEPVADAQHEQTIDIDSELKDGTPADLPLTVVEPSIVRIAKPTPPAPTLTPQAPRVTPPVPAPIQQAPAVPVPAPAPIPPPGFIPEAALAKKPAETPPPTTPLTPTQPPPTPPVPFTPISAPTQSPVAQPAVQAPPQTPKPSTDPKRSIIHEPRSFAAITPLVMRAPVDVTPSAPPTPPSPAATVPAVEPAAPSPMRSPIPIQQDIPGSPTPAPGTVTKQPNASPEQVGGSKPPAEEKKLSVLEQLRAQTASVLHPLRTYQSDAQVRIKASNESLVSVAAAEENRKARAQFVVRPAYKQIVDAPQHHYMRTVLMIAGIAILLAGGVGAIAYVLMPRTTGVEQQQLQTLHPISVDESVELPFGGLTHDQLMQFLTDMRDKTGLSLGLMREIYFTLPTDTGGKRLATVSEVLPRLASHTPAELLRTLDAPFLVGVHVYDGNQGFLILKTNSYEQAYSAMLSWESVMRADLLPFLDRRPGPKLNSEIVPTSTPAKVINSAFVDVVLKNHDVRALYNDVGDIIFLYSFIDRNTILITTNDRTLGEVISRMTLK